MDKDTTQRLLDLAVEVSTKHIRLSSANILIPDKVLPEIWSPLGRRDNFKMLLALWDEFSFDLTSTRFRV